MTSKIDKVPSLEVEAESLRDEIRYLKADQRAKDRELDTARQELQILWMKALQESPAVQIGAGVQMRYLESYRRHMGLPPSDGGNDAKKSGDRAAHRGRPLVDAWLYETGQRKDAVVYKNLYGISFSLLIKWRDIQEVVEVCGFHASLKSDGTMTPRFQSPFKELFDAAAVHNGAEKLAASFKQEKILLSKYCELQNCYDDIISAHPPRRRGLILRNKESRRTPHPLVATPATFRDAVLVSRKHIGWYEHRSWHEEEGARPRAPGHAGQHEQPSTVAM